MSQSDNGCEFEIILDFLKNFSDFRVGKYASEYNEAYINDTKRKYLNAKNKEKIFSPSKTNSDEAVSSVLGAAKGYSEDKLLEIKIVHKESMTAENMVGDLLEDYIESKIAPLGWIRCHGNIVKSVDFLKQNNDGSTRLLQIKNGSTTENSSSDKIRKGTNIEKWYRRNPNNDKNNWVNFPDKEARSLLNEEDFQDFIKQKVRPSE